MKTLIIMAAAIGSLSAATSTWAADIGHVPVLSFAQAKEIQAKAEKVIQSHQIGGSIAIVDASGRLVTFDKLDGSTLANAELAPKKAYTAAAFGAPTESFQQKLAQGNTSILGNPEVVPLPGGIPITIEGHVVGAIGVSTPDGNVDLEAAKAAVAGS